MITKINDFLQKTNLLQHDNFLDFVKVLHELSVSDALLLRKRLVISEQLEEKIINLMKDVEALSIQKRY